MSDFTGSNSFTDSKKLSLGTKQARVSDFSFLNRTNLGSFQCRNGNRFAVKCQKFHLKRFPCFVDVNYRADVTSS